MFGESIRSIWTSEDRARCSVSWLRVAQASKAASGSLMSPSDIAQLDLGDTACRTLRPPSEGEPMCAVREGTNNSFFFFNRDYATRLGVCFPFTEFQMEVLNYLHLTPTQLHQNRWGFVLAFEKFCKLLPIPYKCSIFFYFFCPFTSQVDKNNEEHAYILL